MMVCGMRLQAKGMGKSYLFFLFLTILTVAGDVNIQVHASEEKRKRRRRGALLKCAFSRLTLEGQSTFSGLVWWAAG
jgi:hypothetical protein